MNIYIEHNAKMIAEMGHHSPPACDGIIMKLGDPRDILAVTIRNNPLVDGWLFDTDLPGDRIVTWSGTLGEDLFEPHPMTWMKAGHAAFASFCDDIAPQLTMHGRTLCFQPHARHVLSDPQSCVRFAREHSSQPFEVAFSPISVIEASMLDQLDDHLTRAFEAFTLLAEHSPMLMLHDIAAEDAPRRPVPLGRGVLPRKLTRSLIDRFVDDSMPIVLMPELLDEQLTWLGVRESRENENKKQGANEHG